MAPVTVPHRCSRQLPSTGGCAVVRDGDATIVGVRTRRGAHRVAAKPRSPCCDEVDARRLLGRLLRVRPRPHGRTRARAHRRRPRPPRRRARALRRAARARAPTREPRSSATARTAELLAQAAWRARRADEPAFRAAARDAWTSSPRPRRRIAARVAADPRAARRGRVLPGEPDPPARRAPAPPIRSRCTARSTRANPAPHAALLHVRPDAARRRGRVRVARAVPARRRPRGRDPADQGHRAPTRATLAREREGPRRERDDRRPRPQRPRPRVRARLGRTCPTLCAVEAHPGLLHLVSTVTRPAARRRRARATLVARDVPARVGHRRAEAARAAGDRGPRAGAARRLLRRGRLDRRRRAVAPSSRSRSARSRSPAARTYLGVGGGIVADSQRRRRVGRDRAEGGAPARAPPAPARRAGRRRAPDDRLDQRRARAARRRARSRRSTTACSSATACSRRCASTAACRSRGRATSPGCARRPPGSASRLPDADALRAAADAVLAANELARGAPADHGHRRARAARARDARPTPPTVIVVATRLEPPAPDGRRRRSCRGRATSAARLAGLKTISYAANVRALAYAEERGAQRGDLRQHAGQAVRGDRLERVPRASTACCCTPPRVGRLPARRDARARARARADARHRDRGARRAARRAARTPTRRSSRRRRARCSRSRTSTASRSPAAPGPVTTRARRRVHAPSSPATSTPSELSARQSARRCTTSPAVTIVLAPVVGAHDEVARRRSSSIAIAVERARVGELDPHPPPERRRARPAASATTPSSASSRASNARSQRDEQLVARRPARPRAQVARGRDRRRARPGTRPSARCRPMPTTTAPRRRLGEDPGELAVADDEVVRPLQPGVDPADLAHRVDRGERRRPSSRGASRSGGERRAAAAPTRAATRPAARPTCGRAGPGPRSARRRPRPRPRRARARLVEQVRGSWSRSRRTSARRSNRVPATRVGPDGGRRRHEP